MSTMSHVFTNEQMMKIVSEFTRLKDRCYLENAGASLYPQCLLRAVNEDLLNNVYLNPHTDKYTKDCIEQARSLILNHYNTDPHNYTVIFTSGTTQSLKLVAESFRFRSNNKNGKQNFGSFVYLQDNHTSVLGLREIAQEQNLDIIYIPHEDFLKSLNENVNISPTLKDRKNNDGNNLFVYPAQSNFNGYKYPMEKTKNIKNGCLNRHIRNHLCEVNTNWYVLLDAASFVSTNKLDLSVNQPDFVCLSFYKVFGYPTGLGALLVKNSSADVLSEKKYFGGGTVDVVLSSEDFHVKRKELHERFEDGTVPFLSIVTLKHCFESMNKLIPKTINYDIMDTISHHTYYLAKDLYEQLKNLKHGNGRKAAVLYMDTDFNDIKTQGSSVTFNLLRDDGSYIGYAEFQHMADLFNINVRTGCFCNSGSCQRHLKATNKEIKEMYKAGHKCGDEFDLLNGKPTGAVRASFGYYNTFNDVDTLMKMVCRCFIKTEFIKPNRTSKLINSEAPKRNIINYKYEVMKIINQQEYLPDTHISQTSPISLVEMAIYPIKSCGAFKIKSSWRIGSKGFEYDREWMIINDKGVCLTQKQNTRMCMIKPIVNIKRKLLILNFKGMSSIAIPLDATANNKDNEKCGALCRSKVCTDVVTGIDCGDAIADWISEALDVSYLRLIRQTNEGGRAQKKSIDGDKKLLSLSNQAQFLLVNKATVRWLHEKLPDSMFIDLDNLTDRFRGNLIIDMEQELVEREWQRVIIGIHEFKVEGPCNRCQMVCIDQQTGEKTVEPLRTISEQFGGKMRFGIYLTYLRTVDGSNESLLKIYSPVEPMGNLESVNRVLPPKPKWVKTVHESQVLEPQTYPRHRSKTILPTQDQTGFPRLFVKFTVR